LQIIPVLIGVSIVVFFMVRAIPGVAIALCVLSVNFIGDGLRDALDPRHRR